MIVRLLKSFAWVACLGGLLNLTASGASVTLAWDPSPDPATAGYRAYWGVISQSYTGRVDVGSATQITIPDLTSGTTFFFAVTAYNTSGVESPFSGEITYAIPSLSQFQQISIAGGRVFFSGTGPAGYKYDVLAGGDLANLTKIGTVIVDASGTFQFVDPATATNPTRFFRLLQSYP